MSAGRWPIREATGPGYDGRAGKPGRIMRGKLAVLGVATVAALSGCSALTGGSASATATTGATPATSGSPSPMRVISVTAPAARSGAPALSTTGSNWKSIMTSLTGYGQWLLSSPDPSLVANVATPGCGMSTLLTQQINGLLNSNAYAKTTAPTITQVVGPAATTGGTVGLKMVASRAAEPVISTKKSSVTITTIVPYGATVFTVTLDKGSDSKWRLCDVTTADGSEATIL
jgi:hypothetical protein